MILYIDLASGEVREPALGVIGRVRGDMSEPQQQAANLLDLMMGPVCIELDTKKVEVRVEELKRRGGFF